CVDIDRESRQRVRRHRKERVVGDAVVGFGTVVQPKPSSIEHTAAHAWCCQWWRRCRRCRLKERARYLQALLLRLLTLLALLPLRPLQTTANLALPLGLERISCYLDGLRGNPTSNFDSLTNRSDLKRYVAYCLNICSQLNAVLRLCPKPRQSSGKFVSAR